MALSVGAQIPSSKRRPAALLESTAGLVFKNQPLVAAVIPVAVAVPVGMIPVPAQRAMISPPLPRIAVVVTITVAVVVIAFAIADTGTVRPDVKAEARGRVCR